MYSSKITLFNYYESATTRDAYWYPHVLSGVDLITDLKSTDQTQPTTHSCMSVILSRTVI